MSIRSPTSSNDAMELAMRKMRFLLCGSALLAMMSGSGVLRAQEAAQAAAMNTAEMKFVEFPVMPTCATGAVVSGDPAKGSSIILVKMRAGCKFPWHWHTPNESVMLVSGQAEAQMKDGKPTALRAGGFALMPSKHVHRFSCRTECMLFVHSDAAFDMHYVDDGGKELTPAEALKKVKETPPKPAS